MNLLPHHFSDSQRPVPLHVLLLNYGKGLLQKETLPPSDHQMMSQEMLSAIELLAFQKPEDLERRAREITVKQLGLHLRMQLPEAEEVTMLNSLETLVLAGEIGYAEFVDRVQNLFPAAMVRLENSLRMKIAALVL